MTNIKIVIQNDKIALLNYIELKAGTVGQKCQLFFDDSWTNLSKTITYRVGDTVLASEPREGTEAIVPPKVLATAGLPLEIGITGKNQDNSIIIPTTWCLIGNILPSAYGHAINNNTQIIYDGGVIM